MIRTASIEEIVALSKQIPEFTNPYGAEEYHRRLNRAKHLILIAEIEAIPAGFKVGYERFDDNSFYSWMGGVHPEFRQEGVAKALAEYQQQWAREQGYRSIRLTTRNRHRNMLIFAIKDGFQIVDFRPRAEVAESRIDLEKIL